MSETESPESVSAEAEHRIISICCQFPDSLDRVSCVETDFGDMRWAGCIRELRNLRVQGLALEPLAIMESLVESIPALMLSSLIELNATSARLPDYCRIVTESAAKRRLKIGVSKAMNGFKEGLELNEVLSELSLAISDATVGQSDSAMSIGKIVEARFLQLGEVADAISKGDPAATGILTGIEGLDKHLGGLQKGIVTLLAARPAMGKSAVALNITTGAAKNEIGVHVFSLEDTREAYADRVSSHFSKVSSRKIRTCDITKGDQQQLGMAMVKVRGCKTWLVDDRSGITAEEIVRCVRRNRSRINTQLVVVDYIQLCGHLRGEETRKMLSRTINVFGDAAKQDNMAYLVLSQLNRGLESRDDKRPRLSDLKECGTLEERAKAVVMVYRDAEYNDRADPKDMELLIRKNSNGMTGRVNCVWMPEIMGIR